MRSEDNLQELYVHGVMIELNPAFPWYKHTPTTKEKRNFFACLQRQSDFLYYFVEAFNTHSFQKLIKDVIS